jgi:hypothetical protein
MKKSYKKLYQDRLSKILVCLCILISFGKQSYAQVTATVGTGTSTSSSVPIYSCYGYTYAQQIYTASDISAAGGTPTAGSIRKLRFYLNSGSSTNSDNWTVYMGHTTKTTFSSTTDWIPLSSLTNVFSGTVTYPSSGWLEIVFTTPFTWDGTSNLVVAVDENAPSYYCSNYWNYTSSGSNYTSIYYRNDATNPDPASPPTATSRNTYYPNAQFVFANLCAGTPTAGSAVASATTVCSGTPITLSLSGASSVPGLNYIWDTSSTGTSGWGAVSGVTPITTTTYTTIPPSGKTTYYRCRITCTTSGLSATSSSVSVIAGGAYALPFSESFTSTSLPTCWSVSEGSTGASYHWATTAADATYGASSAASGSYFAYLYVFLASTSYNPYYITSPLIAIPSTGVIRLSYYYFLGTSGYKGTSGATGSDPYPMELQISTDGGLTFTSIYSHSTSNSTFNAWTQNNIDLSSYVGQSVKLRWKSTSNYGSSTCDQGLDEVNVQVIPPCSGAPTAGTVNASPSAICSGSGTTTLSLVGATSAPGITYQWQDSTSGVWNNIASATLATYTSGTLTATKYYRCKIKCTVTGDSTYTPKNKINVGSFTLPFSESFSSSFPSCWSASEGSSGASYHWATTSSDGTHGVSSAYSGSYFMFLDVYDGTTGYNPYYITSPSIVLPVTTTELSYYYFLGGSGYKGTSGATGSDPYPMETQISTDGGLTFTSIYSHSTSNSTFGAWTQQKINVSSYGGNTIKIRWKSNSNWGSSICNQGLDEVNLNIRYCTGAPTAGTLSGPTSAVCPSSAFTISSLGYSDGAGIHYQWKSRPTGSSSPFAISAGDTTTSISKSITAATDYKLYISCDVSGLNDSSAAFTVNVVAKPVLTASGATTFCSNKSLTLSTTSVTGISYKWYNGTVLIPTATTSSYLPTATGKYTIVAYTGFCSGIVSDTTNVTVNPAPVAGISPTGPVSICSGFTTTLTGSGVGKYQWRNASGVLLPGDTLSTYAVAATGTYRVVVTNPVTGCNDTSAFVTVNVTPTPTVSITPVGTTSICADSIQRLKSIHTGTGISYQWYNSGIPISGATVDSFTANTSGDYTLRVSLGTCGNTSNIAKLIVNPLPTANFSNTDTTTAICLGKTLQLTANTIPLTSSYQWYFNGSPISGATSKIYNAALGGVYSVRVRDANNCRIFSDTMTIINTLMNTPLVTPRDVNFCEGTTIVLNSNAGPYAVSYKWTRNGTLLPDTTVSITTALSGDYVVIAKDIFKCVATSEKATINVYATVVKPIITKIGMTLTTGGYASYQWYRNGSAIPGANSRTYTLAFDGNYYVRVGSADGCINTSDIMNIVNLGVVNVSENNMDVNIYPNPSQSIVNIDAPIEVDVQIKDIQGRKIFELKNAKQIDMSVYADGMYIFTVTNKDGAIIKMDKVVKKTN